MKIHNIFGQSPEVRSVVSDVNIVSDRHIGMELEVENAGSLQSTPCWNVIYDGSLRNEGRELVLRQPLAGTDIRRALNELRGSLHTNPALHTSERTSLHVHVDVRDLSMEQVQNILLVYVATESALYKMGGKNRYDNIYCPGITAALEQANLMRKLLSDDVSSFERAVYEWNKYTGINLHSIAERGSIEFRAHEGTTDIRRIYTWVNVLLTMVEYAISLPSRERMLAVAAQGALPLLQAVYGRYAGILAQDGDYQRYYKNNMLNVTDILSDESFTPTRAEGVASAVSGDTASIIESLRQAVIAA